MVRDISERKQTEAALAERERRFRGTFEQAAVGIAHVAPDGRWLRVNDRLCAIIGYPRLELLQRAFRTLRIPRIWTGPAFGESDPVGTDPDLFDGKALSA